MCLCVCVCGVHQLVAAALIIDPREGERGGLSHNQDGGIRGGKPPPPVGGVWVGEIEDDQRRGKTILLVGENERKNLCSHSILLKPYYNLQYTATATIFREEFSMRSIPATDLSPQCELPTLSVQPVIFMVRHT